MITAQYSPRLYPPPPYYSEGVRFRLPPYRCLGCDVEIKNPQWLADDRNFAEPFCNVCVTGAWPMSAVCGPDDCHQKKSDDETPAYRNDFYREGQECPVCHGQDGDHAKDCLIPGAVA